jgi:hypothetical protein
MKGLASGEVIEEPRQRLGTIMVDSPWLCRAEHVERPKPYWTQETLDASSFG